MRKFSRIMLILIFLFCFQNFTIPPVRAANNIDFQNIQLTLEDLPDGFLDKTDNDSLGFEQFAHYLLSQLDQENLPELFNVTTFRNENDAGLTVISSGLLFPLTETQKLLLSDVFAQTPNPIVEISGGTLTEEQFGQINGADRFKISSIQQCGALRCINENIAIMRGNVLLLITTSYPQLQNPIIDLERLADLLDQRLTASMALTERPYRPEVSMVPKISTYIPTPLEVSPNPVLITINLALAAFLLLLFLIAAYYFPSMLENRSGILDKPIQLLSEVQETIDSSIQESFRRRKKLFLVTKILRILLFYGLIYSLLEPGWKPFSKEGVFLFGTMLMANGVVGLSDEFMRWHKLTEWGKTFTLNTPPNNLFLLISSVGISRMLFLRPGLMFGTPKIFIFEEDELQENLKNQLVRRSFYLALGIILFTWLPTIITSHYLQRNLVPNSRNMLASIEAVLLIVFAVELENLFLFFFDLSRQQFKQTLKSPKKEYYLGFLGTAFALFHVLINPKGDLFKALVSGSMFRWMSVVIIFLMIAGIIYSSIKWSKNYQSNTRYKWTRGILAAGAVMLVIAGIVDYFAHKPRQIEDAPPLLSAVIATPQYKATQQNWESFRTVNRDSDKESLPHLPSDWSLILFETFEGLDDSWERAGGVNLNGSRLLQTDNGLLTFTTKASHGESLIFSGLPLESVQDFYLAYDFRQVFGPGDTESGLFFHLQDADKFYYLGITDDGYLWLTKNSEGVWEELITSEYINEYQPCRWNRLAILVQQDRLSIYINGDAVLTPYVFDFNGGSFGLGAWFAREDEIASWQLDNLELRVPD